MTIFRSIHKIGLATVLAFFGSAAMASGAPFIEGKSDTPVLPAVCSTIAVPTGNKPSFHTYAIGVQVYRWNGTRWEFVGPIARLFADANYNGLVGSHFSGPTWMSNSGSSVVGARVDGCTPDANAIPWLLLRATAADGPGIFGRTTFIQRVNTQGGLEPAAAGDFVGQEARVPYTTEYYFYRADD